MFKKKSFRIYSLAILFLLAIDITLFRTMGGLGMPQINEFSWVIRRLINLEQLLLTLAHPFDVISYYFIKEKPFYTPYLYEVVRIIFMPLSYAFYYLMWTFFKSIKQKRK